MSQPPADPAGPEFSVEHEAEPGEALIAGFRSFGVAGVTAVDHSVDDLDLEETGHVRIDGAPSITPFAKGTPRHPIRLYDAPELDITVLIAEQFVPPFLAELLADALLDRTEANGVEEIAVLAGVPVANGPDAHRTFRVATEDYRAARLDDGPDARRWSPASSTARTPACSNGGSTPRSASGYSSRRFTPGRPTSTPRCGSSTRRTRPAISAWTRPHRGVRGGDPAALRGPRRADRRAGAGGERRPDVHVTGRSSRGWRSEL